MGEVEKNPSWIWNLRCNEWTGKVKKTNKQNKLFPLVDALQDVQNSMLKAKRTVDSSWLYTCITLNLSLSRWRRRMLEAAKMSKKTKNMNQAASGGNKLLQRLYCNLHLQPSPEWGAAKQPSQRCAESVPLACCHVEQRGKGAGLLLFTWMFLRIVGGPGRQACQRVGWRAADPGSLCQTGWNGFVLSVVWHGHQRSFSSSLLSLCSTVVSFQKRPGTVGGGSNLPLI